MHASCRMRGSWEAWWWMTDEKTLAAFTTCSIWCQLLGAAQFIGSEKPRQAEPTEALCSATSSSEPRSKQRPSYFVPELPAEVHSSLLLDWSRVLSTEWMGSVCRQSPEDAVARVAKAKSCFCLFYKWKHLASEVDSPAACIPSTQKSVQNYQMLLHYCHKCSPAAIY